MTVYNGETYLKEALESIFNQLNCIPEIIVVNDGSTDRTAEILDSYSNRIRIIDYDSALAGWHNGWIGIQYGA